MKFFQVFATACMFSGASLFAQNSSEALQIGANHSAIFIQDGHNFSDMTQHGFNGQVIVSQVGDDNESWIEQGVGLTSEDNFIQVSQTGTNNSSVIYQEEDHNIALATQIGSNNQIRLEQESASQNTGGNSSSVNQVGDRNIALSNQKTVEISSAAYSNRENVSQDNDDNYSLLQQTGDENASTVNQSGNTSGNFTGSYSNEARVIQDGNFNTSLITQNGLFTADNTAEVTQLGSSHDSVILQTGSNFASVTQVN